MQEFIIKKGKHRSGWFLKLFRRKTSLYFYFAFDKDDWYNKPKKTCVNKLCGFSHGWHHWNSLRIGWQPDYKREGYFDMYFYVYNNGKPQYKKFTSVKAQQIHDGYIKISGQQAWFKINDEEIGIDYITPRYWFGYILFPFFGGAMPAPKEISVWLKMFY